MQNLDLSGTEDVKCDSCEHTLFESAFAIKRVPIERSPTGKGGVIPIPVFICKKCGSLNEEFSLTPERLKQTMVASPMGQKQ